MENARLIDRDARGLGAADRDRRGVGGHQFLARRSRSGVQHAMLEKAMRLCTAAFGYLMTFDGEHFQPVAHRGLPAPFADYLLRMDQPGPSGGLCADPSRGPAGACRGSERRGGVSNQSAASGLGRSWRCPHRTFRRAPQGRGVARRLYDLPPGSEAVRGQRDRTPAELRRAGGDCDGERAADRPRRARRWSSRLRPPRYCKSSTPHLATSPRCSTRCWKRRCTCATPDLAPYGPMTAPMFTQPRCHNVPPIFAEFLARAPHPVGPDSAHGRLLRGEAVVHISDIVAEEAYRLGDPIRRALR